MENMIKAILLDDDPVANALLKDLLTANHPNVEIVGVCETSDKALSCIVDNSPDIVFLDIEMPDKNGFEFFESLSKVNVQLQCVLVSSHLSENFQKAMDLELTLYLEKPVWDKDLAEVLHKCIDRIRNNKYTQCSSLLDYLDVKRKILLTTTKGLLYVYPEEFLYAKADRKCTNVWIDKVGQIKVMKGITDLYNLFDNSNIFKPDKSWLVNLIHLKEIHELSGELVLQGQDEELHKVSITNEGFANLKRHVKSLRMRI